MKKNAIKASLNTGGVFLLVTLFVAQAASAGQGDSAQKSSGMSASRGYNDVHEMTLFDGTNLAGTITAQTSHSMTIVTSDSATISIPVRLIRTFDTRPYSVDSSSVFWKGNDALNTRGREESSGISPGASTNDLLAALRSFEWKKRSAAAHELGARGQGEGGIIEAVSALLGDTVTESSLLQILQVDSSEQAKLLSPGLEAAKALAKMESRGYDELARKLNSANPLVRRHAAFGLGESHNNLCVPILMKALKDRDPRVRAAAAGSLHFSEATPELIKAIDDNDERVRAGAVTALGRIGDTASENALAAALGDVNSSVRSAAATALGKIGGKAAITFLAKAVNDPESNVRLNAVVALVRIRDTATVPSLIACLKDRDGVVVKTAALALGDIRDSRAISPLRSTLQTCPESIRSTVDLSLKRLTEIPFLIGALEDRDTLVRRNAEYLLWLISGKKFGNDKKAWTNWFVSRSDSEETRTPELRVGDTTVAPQPK
jgi:HEAT repeat protein